MLDNLVSKKIINYLAVSIIFSDAFSFWVYPHFELRISYLIIFLILSISLVQRKIYFNRTFLVLFIAIVCFSLINVYLNNDTVPLLLKQVIGILINSIFFYNIIRFNNKDLKSLFVIYLKVALIVSAIGLLQEISFLLKFEPLYNFKHIIPKWAFDFSGSRALLRINSIMFEPSTLCVALMPALFVAVHSIFSKDTSQFINKKAYLVIIITFMLSLSSVGYVGLFIAILLLVHNLKPVRLAIGLIVVFCLVLLLYFNLPGFKLKVDDTSNVITAKSELETSNQSTFTLFTNALIAGNVLKNNLFIGNGLGSHQVSYQKYINKVLKIEKVLLGRAFLNSKDANSLLLRILSETGLFGLCIFLAFIFRFYINHREDNSGYLWAINNAILILFIVRLIRQGHYFSEGFFFSFWFYYFTKKELIERT